MKSQAILLFVIIVLLVSAKLAAAYKAVEFVLEFGGKGEAPGKFSEETRFAFDRDGNIYVVDTDNYRVQKLNPDGSPIMEIAEGHGFLLRKPMDVAVDGDMNIYVADWGTVYVQGTDSPRIFNYGPCVHKFASDGGFIDTFTLEDLSQKAQEKESAVPAVDTDGSFALMIVPEKTDRHLYISADVEGNVYVLDQDTIHKLSSSGEILSRFAGPSRLDKATGIAVDDAGNVYVADTGNHRISKFSPDGKFLFSFGRRGDSDGQFMDSLYVTAARDGTILVSDSASYEKILRTSVKQRKIINSSILVTGQDDPLIPRTRDFKTVMRRFQRFDEDGKFLEKILYRIDKSDPELRDMEFKAIDPDGNLYLIDKDTLLIRKYSIRTPVRWSEIEKTFSYRLQHSDSRSQIDNFYDLNSYFDFSERETYTMMIATMKLNYDMTETFGVSMVGSLTRLNAKTYDDYPGEYADPSGYIQDDETTDKYTAVRMRLDFSLILDHDPFRYRVGDLFVYFGGGRYDFDVVATDFSNRRRLDENLWWAVWAVGMRYDMGDSLRLSLTAAQHRPPGFMNYEYEYWDESGDLYGTGFGDGASTEVFISVDGAF
jgi:DNA-binding beta-propeller fold protein YncE